MTRLRYHSLLEFSGYGLASLALLKGLLAANADFQWVPLAREGFDVRRLKPSEWPDLLEALHERTEALDGASGLAALLERSVDLHESDIHLVHCMPESWGQFFADGKRNIGFTAWENDSLPPHWVPCLSGAHDIIVPCQHNRDVIGRQLNNARVHVLPHVLNAVGPPAPPNAARALTAALEIPDDHVVFYSIDTWSPRKNLPGLMEAFACAFDASEPVSLIIKTEPSGYGVAPFYPKQSTEALFYAECERLRARLGRALPHMVVLPYVMSESGMGMLHAHGDIYVSASHGEGWGLSVFEAVGQYAKPVIVGAYAGVLDYLPADYPGLVPVRMETVPVWPPSKPLFWPPQRWAVPDTTSLVDRMRQAVRDRDGMLKASRAVSSRCQQQFNSAVVTQRLLNILG